MDIDMEISRANSYKSTFSSDEERLAEFWERMSYELN